MATIKLTPSSYYLSSSTYLSVSSAASMYTDTDSTTYATVTNSRANTTSYYIYLRGFNFDDIPSAAVVNSFTIRLKARQSGVSTSTSYKPYLANGTSAINGTCDVITTTATVHEFNGLSADWETILGYGEDFGIRINCRRASRNTTGYMYIYGAEIEVNYTAPNPAVITSSLVGNGTISPSGAYSTYDDEEYTITITPDDVSEEVVVTNNGVDVTSQLVAHGAGSSIHLQATDSDVYDIGSGSSYASYAVGCSAEDPSSYGESSNMYSSSGDTGYAEYYFDFSGIPSNATIENITVNCYGHRESSTIDSSHVSQIALYNGHTLISDEVDFPSTSNTIITAELNTQLSRSDLSNVTLRHTVGYYGGLVLGITLTVTYSVGTGIDHYTYTYTVSGDAMIVVTIGSQEKMYLKVNGTWATVDKVYKKINGAWVEQTDLASVFNTSYAYVHGS